MLRALVEAAQHGDRGAFEELVARVLDRCYVTAAQILRDPAAAEDAVQEAMIRAWRDLPTLRDPDRFEGWLRRLLVHACYDQARTVRRHRNVAIALVGAVGDAIPDQADTVIDRDTVERVLARLSPAHRAAIVLRHVLGLAVPEVADAMGIPLGTAKSRLHHAERALRAVVELEPQGGRHER